MKSVFSFLLCQKKEENVATKSDYKNYLSFTEEQKFVKHLPLQIYYLQFVSKGNTKLTTCNKLTTTASLVAVYTFCLSMF